jgi:ketopantoate hydroxymethyltransferase
MKTLFAQVGMVVLGYDTTLPVTFEEILHHCRHFFAFNRTLAAQAAESIHA